MNEYEPTEEQTAIEKKLELEKHDEWSKARIAKDWKESARQSRLRILAKYNSPLRAPMESVQANDSI